jgi:small subunit ribosomal protein S19
MARSLKRTFVHYKLDKKVQENIAGGNKGGRHGLELNDYPDFVGQTIAVHNGRQFVPSTTEKHGRSQIREFSPTRSLEVIQVKK